MSTKFKMALMTHLSWKNTKMTDSVNFTEIYLKLVLVEADSQFTLHTVLLLSTAKFASFVSI